MKKLNIYISGYCNDIRVGGYGVIIEHNGITRKLSAPFYPTTKRRIMLQGITATLKTLPESCEITMYIDSGYVINNINKGRVEYWRNRGWRISDGRIAKNADLWKQLLVSLSEHNVNFVWIREYNGFEYGHEYNDRCRELALEAVKRGGPL